MDAKRMTVRFDADGDFAWEAVERLCDVTGATRTSMMVALLHEIGVVWQDRGFAHPATWDDDDPFKSSALRFTERALEIQRGRRARD